MSKQNKRKLIAEAVVAASSMTPSVCLLYYTSFIPKHLSSTAGVGYRWTCSILEGNHEDCMNFFRMEAHVVDALCNDLVDKYGLSNSTISPLEKVAIFLYILGRGRTTRDARNQFSHSNETIHRVFHEVLNCISGRAAGGHGLCSDILQPIDPLFTKRHPIVTEDRRYRPWFKDCIGAIDGTHIKARVKEEDSPRYRDRQGHISFNVLVICDFDMHVTYVMAGYEGSAHDAKVLHCALSPEFRDLYPHPPSGKYYVADKGFPERVGLLTPFAGERYHLRVFRTTGPTTRTQFFNKRHSSLRSIIERLFGCVKSKWHILDEMPRGYSVQTQTDITKACFALHNFIRFHKRNDEHFAEAYHEPTPVALRGMPEPLDADHDPVYPEWMPPTQQRAIMAALRNEIADNLWASRGTN